MKGRTPGPWSVTDYHNMCLSTGLVADYDDDGIYKRSKSGNCSYAIPKVGESMPGEWLTPSRHDVD